jgi:hypothetical protein
MACIWDLSQSQAPGRLRHGAALFLGGLAVATALALPSHALAGTYKVAVCTPSADAGSQLVPASPLDIGFASTFGCAQPLGGVALRALGPESVGEGDTWVLTAPADTTIAELELDRTLSPMPAWGNDRLFWSLTTRNPRKSLEVVRGNSLPADGGARYTVNSGEVVGLLLCDPRMSQSFTEWCKGSSGTLAEVSLTNIFATMEDNLPPTFTATPPSPTKPLRGTVQIPYEAEDKGSGFRGVNLLLDFDPAQVTNKGTPGQDLDLNGGKCEQPFTQMVPCELHTGERHVSLETTAIPDGTHTITPLIFDAAGNAEFATPFTILVHNAPTNTARPTLSGEAKVGQALSASNGQWEGASPPLRLPVVALPAERHRQERIRLRPDRRRNASSLRGDRRRFGRAPHRQGHRNQRSRL